MVTLVSIPVTTVADRLAAQLTTAETAIRDPATPASKRPALGRTQQAAYRILVRHPRLVPKVLAQLSPALRRVVEANVLAGSELRKLNGPAGRLPRWRIVAPAPAAQLLAAYRAAQAKLAVPWEYLAAIHLVETRAGRIRGTSSAGAQGPMQFLPSWLQRRFREQRAHLQHLVEGADGLGSLLSNMLQAYLTEVSARQNDDMRRISAWVAIWAVPTLLAGIYGMNFRHMPELDWRFAYPVVLVIMVAVCLSLYRGFRRSGWL